MNEVQLIGNLGADPEMKTTQDGRPVANLRIATSEKWRDKSTGERKEKVEWHRVVCFSEGLCNVIEQYLRKGSKVFIRGKLQTRKWTDQSGAERYSTEVVLNGYDAKLVMLDKADRGGGGSSGGDDWGSDDFGRGAQPRRQSGGGQRSSRNTDMDDDIPF